MGNILIIDNSPENLQILTELTAGQNYQVYTAKTAEEAIESAKNSSPDLILLNVWLPDLNGFDLCKQLKSDDATKDVPVIFICSPDKTSDKAKCFQVGGADFVTTPFQPEEVVARIQTHLNTRLMRTQIDRQEAIMRSTETSFRNLFDNMSEGVALHELIYNDRNKPVNYRILSINPAFTIHTGLKKELVTGKLATDAFATDIPP